MHCNTHTMQYLFLFKPVHCIGQERPEFSLNFLTITGKYFRNSDKLKKVKKKKKHKLKAQFQTAHISVFIAPKQHPQ